MITSSLEKNVPTMFCLSTDNKDLIVASNATILLEMDTKKVYIYDEEHKQWLNLSD